MMMAYSASKAAPTVASIFRQARKSSRYSARSPLARFEGVLDLADESAIVELLGL